MNFFMTFILIFSSLLLASDSVSTDKEKQERLEKQIQIEMEREKKYAKEQTFYQQGNYDLKGSEVNKDSLSTLPDLEEDEFDMDSVYD
ncbi:MAG: hypothetical protein J7J96_04275 [Sulfurimonas sp.]|nr:hypothetical protein [Sulfurimonas sp.]